MSILDICKLDGANKTAIANKANLNFRTAGAYLDWLTKREYLVKESGTYKITSSGLVLLNSIKSATFLISDCGR